jgi:hypothetical protein
MYDYQNGNCAGCNDSIKKIDRATHIDHDHKTELVRGILCQSCNTVLGYAKDDTHRLQGLIHYLEYKK